MILGRVTRYGDNIRMHLIHEHLVEAPSGQPTVEQIQCFLHRDYSGTLAYVFSPFLVLAFLVYYVDLKTSGENRNQMCEKIELLFIRSNHLLKN